MPAKGAETSAFSPRSQQSHFMKKFARAFLALMISIPAMAQEKKTADTALMQPVEVIAMRAGDNTPVARTSLLRKDIEKNNTGRDLPFLLEMTPSVLASSDAGNGIGYTGIRIRGTDASRINVTINNIPYNDAESQGTFFVDVPDLASSASSIQIQRGIGTSVNGAGAFGASINVSTNEIKTKSGIELSNSAGSYGSMKNTLQFNSGLMRKHLTLDGRLSRIVSEGYIDRAFSRLYSGYLSAAYISKGYSIRFNVIDGKEKTYQAWYGIRQDILDTNRTYNPAGMEKPGTPYDNETDNYRQTHYQLFQNLNLDKSWKASLAMFLTRGKGYYEQYKADQAFADYGLPDFNNQGTQVSATDLIRRLWLDNYYYGSLLTLRYKKGRSEIISGAGYTRYEGNHYGEIVRSLLPGAITPGYRWYDLDAFKNEYSAFSKWQYRLHDRWTLYIDGQIRGVDYRINGFRNNPGIRVSNNYFFFNPKMGITHNRARTTYYLSFARAAKEPNRDDFEAAANEQPRQEILNDLEAGMEWRSEKVKLNVNLYHMGYRDQLVLTGRINDVGAYARTNIPNSYRAGIEISSSVKLHEKATFFATLTWSRNRIKNFTEYVYDYDSSIQRAYQYSETDISFSPSVISSAGIEFKPFSAFTLLLQGKYAGRQYLDNTSSKDRSLDPYFVTDMKADYRFRLSRKIQSTCFLHLMNVFSEKFEPNGYSFSYIYGGSKITENYYFPMAPLQWMAGFTLSME